MAACEKARVLDQTKLGFLRAPVPPHRRDWAPAGLASTSLDWAVTASIAVCKFGSKRQRDQ
jgi:hypothetical protein